MCEIVKFKYAYSFTYNSNRNIGVARTFKGL